jgi:hypothetical protein
MVIAVLLFPSSGTEEKSLILHWYPNMRALVHELVPGDRIVDSLLKRVQLRHQLVPPRLLCSGILQRCHGVLSCPVADHF